MKFLKNGYLLDWDSGNVRFHNEWSKNFWMLTFLEVDFSYDRIFRPALGVGLTVFGLGLTLRQEFGEEKPLKPVRKTRKKAKKTRG